MSKATVAKLVVLIFLAFIVCLPEFFPSNAEVHIPFRCLPFDPCNMMGGHAPKHGQICEVYMNASKINPMCESEPKKNISQDRAPQHWFVCETQANLRRLLDNTSVSEVDVEVVLMLQLTNQTLKNVTMHGHFNHSGLHIEAQVNFSLLSCCTLPKRNCTYPDKVKTPPTGSATSSPASYKPVTSAEQSIMPSSGTVCQSDRSECIYHYAGSNIFNTHSTEVRWWGFSATVWIVLVLIVFVVVLLSVWAEVNTSRCCFHKQSAPPQVKGQRARKISKRRVKSLGDLPDVSISIWSTEDEELFLEELPKDYSRGKVHLAYQEMYKRALSPIHEVSMTDVPLDENDEEKRPEDTVTEEGSDESLNFDHVPAHTKSLPCLHHRGHPSYNNADEST